MNVLVIFGLIFGFVLGFIAGDILVVKILEWMDK